MLLSTTDSDAAFIGIFFCDLFLFNNRNFGQTELIRSSRSLRVIKGVHTLRAGACGLQCIGVFSKPCLPANLPSSLPSSLPASLPACQPACLPASPPASRKTALSVWTP